MSAPQTAAARRADMLLHGPILATILKLAGPNIVVMLAQASANFLESYYVGLLGVDALAGAALVFPLVMLMQMMSAGGIGGSISSSIARALGAGQHEKAETIALHAVIVAIGFGIVFGVAAIIGGPLLYTAMGGQGAALQAALDYSNAIFVGAIALWLLNALASILRGTGNMMLPAAVLTGGVGVLLVGSPALIFGFGPIPALGVTGAGLALVLYYVLGCIVLGIALLRGRAGLRLDLHHKISRAIFGDILGVGALAVINNFTTNLAVVVSTTLVSPLGTPALAGFGLGIRLEYLQIPIVFGFGTGMVAMIGMNVGAGQMERARAIAWTGAGVAAAMTEIVGLAAALFPHAWLHLFTDDEQAIAIGVRYLHVVAPAYGLFGLGLAFYFASQGRRRMRWSVIAGMVRIAIVAVVGTATMRLTGNALEPFLSVLVVGLAAFAAINALPWAPRLQDAKKPLVPQPAGQS